MFNYVCRLDDNKVIRSYGYTDFIGQFDPEIYVQVMVDSIENLPENWEQENLPNLEQRINTLIQDKSFDEQKEVFRLKPIILDVMVNGSTQIADSFIDDSSLTQQTKDEFKSIL